MTEELSKDIDRLVDAIDRLIVLRAERMHLRGADETADDYRIMLGDAFCDFVHGLKDEL